VIFFCAATKSFSGEVCGGFYNKLESKVQDL